LTEPYSGQRLKEISRQQTLADRPWLFTVLSRKDTQRVAIAEAYRTHRYQMQEIAEFLRIFHGQSLDTTSGKRGHIIAGPAPILFT